tara:strand:+ start:218 stop:457 length:240 start_codon:yes stop_codon:yes gene_type:complete
VFSITGSSENTLSFDVRKTPSHSQGWAIGTNFPGATSGTELEISDNTAGKQRLSQKKHCSKPTASSRSMNCSPHDDDAR